MPRLTSVPSTSCVSASTIMLSRKPPIKTAIPARGRRSGPPATDFTHHLTELDFGQPAPATPPCSKAWTEPQPKPHERLEVLHVFTGARANRLLDCQVSRTSRL